MDFLKNLKFDLPTLLKIAGIGLAAIILITVAGLFIRIAGSSFQSIVPSFTKQGMPLAYDSSESAGYGADEDMKLSTRNIVPPQPGPVPGQPAGDTAEEYEVTEYSANIETRRLAETCGTITELKTRDDVIFERTDSYDRGCSVTFKVKTAAVEEILGIIRALDPKDLNENTYTIKAQIDDFTSETEILKNKLASIDATLANAVGAYDELTELATDARDVESLTKIIGSKLDIIERLTQQRIAVTSQLERLERAKADQLDRLEYTYFHVSVTENVYIDGEQLADSWREAVKNMVRDINRTLQDVSIGLLALAFVVAQYVLYLFIVVVVAKYVWRAVVRLWRR